MQNSNNIKLFCQSIWGKGVEGCFRVFKSDGGAINLNGTYEKFENYLTIMSEAGNSIFFIPNQGGHTDLEITKYNAVFIDIDAGGVPSQWHQIPNYIFVRGDKAHAYWLLPQPNDYDETKFRTVQKQLAQHYNSDPVIINPSRVMRLPYFNHIKKGITSPGYQEIHQQIATVSSDPSWGLAPLAPGNDVTYDAIEGEDIICENWITVDNAIGFLQRRDPGVTGEGGDAHMRATFS